MLSAVLTNATRAYGTAIARAYDRTALMLLKKFPVYLENQKNRIWKDAEGCLIIGSNILIVGAGDIGMEFASRMKAFGAI